MNLKAQVNLVPNSDFEQFDTCPNTFSQMAKCTSWYSSRPTADYFNACAPVYSHPYTCVNVPYTSFGFRYPSSGNGFAGIIVHNSFNDGREHIGCELINPLEFGRRYYCSLKIALGGYNQTGICGANKIGLLFSTVRYDSLNPSPICNSCAQIVSDSIIVDTLNWTIIRGSFIADSNYSYLYIGRFNSNSTTDTIQLYGNSCWAYYFIDDAYVSSDSLINSVLNLTANPTKFIVAPNPFVENVRIIDKAGLFNKIFIYDQYGNKMLEDMLADTDEYTLSLSQLVNGLYYIIICKDGIIVNQQIVIKTL